MVRRLALTVGGGLLIAQGLIAVAGWPEPFTTTLKGIPAPIGSSWRNALWGLACAALGFLVPYYGFEGRGRSK